MAATSIHIEAVKTGSEQHNKREKELDYVMKSRTHLNEYWQSDTQEQRLADIKQLVKEKTGRKLQKIATPLREGVVVIKPTTTMDDLQKFADAIRKRWGIDCFQIAIHRDEGTKDKINYHAHMVFDFMNHSTGKSIKIGRTGASELQDIAAETLDMDRGVSSDIEHLSAIQFKNQAEAEKLKRTREEQQRVAEYNGKLLMHAENERKEILKEAQQEREQLQQKNDELKQDIMKAEEKKKDIERKAVTGAKVSTANAIAAIGNTITEKLGLNKTANELKHLKETTPKVIEKKTQEALEKGRNEGRETAISEIMEAANLTFGTAPATTEKIGRAWGRAFEENKRLKDNFQILLKKDKDKGLYNLAEMIVEGIRKNYFNDDSPMIEQKYVSKGGFEQTRITEKDYTRKDIQDMFNKLCQAKYANNGTDITAIKMHRQLVAGTLAIHCLYGLNKAQMQKVDNMLMSFANDYEIPKMEEQEKKQKQEQERKQTQEHSRTRGGWRF